MQIVIITLSCLNAATVMANYYSTAWMNGIVGKMCFVEFGAPNAATVIAELLQRCRMNNVIFEMFVL